MIVASTLEIRPGFTATELDPYLELTTDDVSENIINKVGHGNVVHMDAKLEITISGEARFLSEELDLCGPENYTRMLNELTSTHYVVCELNLVVEYEHCQRVYTYKKVR